MFCSITAAFHSCFCDFPLIIPNFGCIVFSAMSFIIFDSSSMASASETPHFSSAFCLRNETLYHLFGVPVLIIVQFWKQRTGFRGVFWKAARMGERPSPWVAVGCFTFFSEDNQIDCILHHQSIQLRHWESSQLRSGTMCSHSVSHPVFSYNEKKGCSKMFLVSVCAFFLVLDGSPIKHILLNLSQPPNYQKSLNRKTLIWLELFVQTMAEYSASRTWISVLWLRRQRTWNCL
ncbi:hypothetical protein ACS0TY_019780 [Phlomoides rotata]